MSFNVSKSLIMAVIQVEKQSAADKVIFQVFYIFRMFDPRSIRDESVKNHPM